MDIDVLLIRKDKVYTREVAPGDYQDKLRFVGKGIAYAHYFQASDTWSSEALYIFEVVEGSMANILGRMPEVMCIGWKNLDEVSDALKTYEYQRTEALFSLLSEDDIRKLVELD